MNWSHAITIYKTIRMKAFLCFALFAVASAIPLLDQVVIIQDGPVPIPVEMLRSGSLMPVWRDLPQPPQVFVPIPERNFRDFANFKVSDVQFVNEADLPEGFQSAYAEIPSADEQIVPEPVKVVDFVNDAEENVPADEIAPLAVKVVDFLVNDAEEIVPQAEEIVPQAEIVPEPVNVVEYVEPAADILAPELGASEDAEMRFVKFVDSPATFDIKNMKVPIDAHDIV